MSVWIPGRSLGATPGGPSCGPSPTMGREPTCWTLTGKCTSPSGGRTSRGPNIGTPVTASPHGPGTDCTDHGGGGLGLGGPSDGPSTATLRPSANPWEATARITCWKEPGGSSERPEMWRGRGGEVGGGGLGVPPGYNRG